MTENRRNIDLWSAYGSDGGYDRVSSSMEKQLRVQEQIVAAEQERRLAVEQTREQQELMGRNAAEELNLLRTEAADPAFARGVEQTVLEADRARVVFDEMQESGRKFIESSGTGFRNFFKQVFNGELTSAKDVFDLFCKSLTNIFANTLAKMASSWTDDLLGSLFSSLGSGGGSGSDIFAGLFHSGGIAGEAGVFRATDPFVFAGAPRLHSGLAPDEFPAILQQGEAVIPRGRWSGGQQAQNLNVEVNIDNRSGTPLQLEQGPVSRELDRMVISIVARDIHEYGVLGKMFQNGKRG